MYVCGDGGRTVVRHVWQACSSSSRRPRPVLQLQLTYLFCLYALPAAKGLASGAPVVSAMIGLAELRLDAGDAVGALEAAKRGIKFVFDRNKVRMLGESWWRRLPTCLLRTRAALICQAPEGFA
jgi:hypothetical protein